jgi:tetratricopeptide (TPR) repeat protein
MHMIFIYLERGEKERARAWSELIRQEAPTDTGVHFVRATIHRLDGEYEEALKSLDRMLRLNPAERVVVSYNRARIFLYQSRFADALTELDQGAAVEAHHPLLRLFRATILHRMGDAEAAIKLMRELLAERPGMDGARPILAAALATAGDHAGARAELTERVLAVAASDHDIAYWLACVYAIEGERDEAFRWLEQAINLGNENRPWFEADTLLENIRNDARFAELMERIKRKGTPSSQPDGETRNRASAL